jgi:hypothetical protein
VRVAAINGTNVTIDSPIRSQNWAAGKNPRAGWSQQRPRIGVGIEDLTINVGSVAGDSSGVVFMAATNSWVKGVRILRPDWGHIRFYQSAHITIESNFFYDGQSVLSTAYSMAIDSASDLLIQNNIYDQRSNPFAINGPCSGCVVAYNYVVFQPHGTGAYQPGTVLYHEAGTDYMLIEGNDFPTIWHDDIHGTTHFHTHFRNMIVGHPNKNSNTQIFQINSYGRYVNIIGNVLGRSGYYTTYNGSSGTSIYDLGRSPGSPVPADAKVSSTMFRWGNYDTVNNSNRFLASEVPTGDPRYPVNVPATQTLPTSLYTNTKPAWFGTVAWPPIGPDVTGGTVSGYGGRANKIPARVCRERLANANGSDFNAATCYQAVGGDTTPPAVPTGLTIR